MGIREAVRQRINEKTKTFGDSGNWIAAGAIYVFNVENVKVFEGYKSKVTGIVEFSVDKVESTQPEAFYKEQGKYPQQVGATASTSFDLLDEYKTALFMRILSAITHETQAELVKPAGDPKDPEALTYEKLIQIGDGPVSQLKGLKVKCEAWLGDNQKKTQKITKTKWTQLPAPADHPLAAAINEAK